MAKPLVERYEQILAEDPTSSVFVELAKALLAQNEWDRAIEVCRGGLEHHPQSVTARVLWGRALIHLGKPAPAMEQFDLAIGIDRENPHAYNLISEVLLQKGLYRSALPILRKAVALQPHDARVQAWLEQTQAVLKGGPTPDFTLPDALAPQDPEAAGAAQAAADPAPSPGGDAGADGGAELSELETQKTPIAPVDAQGSAPKAGSARPTPPPPGEIPQLFPREDAPGERADPDAATPQEGTPAVRPARKSGVLSAAWEVGPMDRPRPADAGVDPAEERTQVFELPLEEGADPLQGADRAQDNPWGDEEATQVATGEGASGAPSGGGLLDDLPPATSELGPTVHSTRDLIPEVVPANVGAPLKSGGGLLDDLPLPTAPQSPAPQKVAIKLGTAHGSSTSSSTNSATLASEYERELREKLEKKRAERGARSKRLVQAVGALVLVGAVAAAAWAYTDTREDFGGKDLKGALADARRLVGEDTRASIHQALETLGAATRMDANSTEAWSLIALSHGLLASDHEGGDASRNAARDALAKEGVTTAHPGTRLVVDWLLAEGRSRELHAEALLESRLPDAEVQALAGRILLERDQSKDALARFQEALKASPTHVRTLLALGAYFREAGDDAQASEMYERVEVAHPEKVLGELEIGLVRDEVPDDATERVAALGEQELRTPDLRARRLLVLARLQSRAGAHAEAIATAERAVGEGVRALQSLVTLSAIQRAAGETTLAQATAQKAMKLAPDSQLAQEALGRALLSRDRSAQLLTALAPDTRNPTVSLMRGLARARQGDWKRARAELKHTEMEGRFPPEAVVALALADAASGRPEKAQEALERLLVSGNKVPDSIRVALGRVYWQRGLLAKARAQFEEAAERPRDVEGNLQLGKLLLTQGQYREALAPLQTAVSRNAGDDEARAALAQTLLGLGKAEEAKALLATWVKADPDSARAQLWIARSAVLAGDADAAAKAAARAVKLEPQRAEIARVHALALALSGSAGEAFKALQRANKLDPADAETFCEIGWTFLRQGNPDNAGAAFAAALKHDPLAVCARAGQVEITPRDWRDQEEELTRLARDAQPIWDRAEWLVALSNVQRTRGDAKAARKSAEDALQLVPGLARGQAAAARAAQRARDVAGARAAWDRAVALDPSNASYRLAQGDMLARERDRLGDAVLAYEAYLELIGNDADGKRVRKLLPTLRKRLATR